MEEVLYPAKKAYLHIGIGLLLIAIVSVVAQYLFAIIVQVMRKHGVALADKNWILWAATFIPIYVIAIPMGLTYMKKVPNSIKKSEKLSIKRFLTMLLVCFPMFYFGNVIGSMLSQLLSGGTAENALETYVEQTGILKIVVMVLVGPLIEEFVFRRTLINKTRQYGEKQAVLFSAVAFALFHMNLYQMFYAFGLGLVFGYVYLKTGKLIYSYILHVIVNLIGSVIAPFVAGLFDADTMIEAAEEADWSALIHAYVGMTVYYLYVFAIMGLSVWGLIVFANRMKKLTFDGSVHEMDKSEIVQSMYLNVGFILFAVVCIAFMVLNLLN